MKRKIKNIIMILIFIVGCILICFTIKDMNKNFVNDESLLAINEDTTNENIISEDGEIPDEKPDSKPDSKPDNKPEEKPSTKPSHQPSQKLDEKPDAMPGEETDNNDKEVIINNNNLKYYVIFTILDLVTVADLIYLIFSKFNKYNFKETFSTKKRIIFASISFASLVGILFLIIVLI